MSRNFLLNIVGLLGLLLIWWVGAWFLSFDLPLAKLLSPVATFYNLFHLLVDGILTRHIIVSLKRVVIGLIFALIIGVPLGLAVGKNKSLEHIHNGIFQMLRMISPLSWMPIVIMIFGIGDVSIYFLLTFAAIWPIILNTSIGVKSINPYWLQLGESLSSTKWEIFHKIIIPAVTSHILTGLRLAIGIVWIILVPCEMLGVNDGLGYFILDTRDRLAYSELMAVIVLIGIIGLFLDSLIRYIQENRIR